MCVEGVPSLVGIGSGQLFDEGFDLVCGAAQLFRGLVCTLSVRSCVRSERILVDP